MRLPQVSFSMAMVEPVETLRRVLGEEKTEAIGSANAARLFGFGG